ncbi:MAG TPA: diphthine--ammonia ligase [Bacteroidia bacterium]|jgi:uncharacterized protein (TIGR00290 family)
MKEKAVFCWSGGKDSALCLHRVLAGGKYEVHYLLTTLNENYRRISMHGVREELLDAQAAAVGIPLLKIFVHEGTNSEYEKKMEALLLRLRDKEGITKVIFGDIFLEDLRKYREDNLAKVNMKAVFPLWKQDTKRLLQDFIGRGFETVLCCTNDAFLGEEWCGRKIDRSFLEELPANVDPCGENGEYHTFCFAGPLFNKRIAVKTGEKIYRPLEVKESERKNSRTQGFWYCELLKAD